MIFGVLLVLGFSQFLSGEENKPYDAETLFQILNEQNIPCEIRPLLKEYGGFGSSLHVYFPAPAVPASGEEDTSAGTFVLAVPMDSAFAVETALAFAGKAKANSGSNTGTPKSLLIAFLDNEKSVLDNPAYSHKGLKDLISLPDMPETWIVCCLDSAGVPETIQIRHGSGSYIAPLELVKPLPPLFTAFGIPASFEARYNELYKLELIAGSRELSLLRDGEINGICLYGQGGNSGVTINANTMAAALMDYAVNLSLPLQNPDDHYTILSFAGKIAYIPEKALILFLIISAAALFAGFLILSAIHRIIIISRLRLFIKRGWIFILFLPLMIFIVRGIGLFYGSLHRLLDVPLPEADFLGSLLIILLAIWFFAVLSHVMDYFHFPRRAALYGVSAIVIAGVGVLAAAILDLTFVAVFFWAFLFSLLGGTIKKPALVFFSACVIPVRALGTFDNIREAGGLPIHLFTVQGDSGNWIAAVQIAVLCLPVILLLKRGLVLIHTESRAKKKTAKQKIRKLPLILRFVSLGLLVALMVLMVKLSPGKAQGLAAAQAGASEDFSLSLSETVFQESRIIAITMQAQGSPLLFDLFLKSEKNEAPLIYSAPIPVERLPDNSVHFILGEKPPNPLNLEIVIRRDFEGAFLGTAVFNGPRQVQAAPVFLTR